MEALKSRYQRRGYGHGHRAGLMLENRPAFFFHWLALNGLGVSVVPINSEWRSAELEYLVRHSEICGRGCTRERVDGAGPCGPAAGRPLVVDAADLADLRGGCVRSAPHRRCPRLDTECALLYTSGTTGRPKGCVLPNEYYLWAGILVRAGRGSVRDSHRVRSA